MVDYIQLELKLLGNIKNRSADLSDVLRRANDHWGYEDGLYRFYHQSFKVYDLQKMTLAMVAALTAIAPDERPFCDFFQTIIREGTGRRFTFEVNERWLAETAPIVQAFQHARYFVEMATKYSAQEKPPQPMPSGWAALLCLFDLR